MRAQTDKEYPRPDKEYRKKESVDFQQTRSAIYRLRPQGRKIDFYRWVLYFLTGMLTGIIFFVWNTCCKLLVRFKWDLTQQTIDSYSIGTGYATYIGISLAFSAIAVLLTIKLYPLAAGGGTTEMIGYFNGVDYPGVFSKRLLFVKNIALMFAIAAGFCIGKEGVIAQIGSIIGYWLLYLPLPFTKYFRNNEDKRFLACAGTAAGVAAAFGSPIGGTLFAYEIASPATFWSFELTWGLFFTSCVTCFFCSLCEGIWSGNILSLTNAGLIKFGNSADNVYEVYDLISFVIMGIVGGLLGALFCWVNYQMGVWRKKYLTTDFRKFSETMIILLLTGTCLYFVPLIDSTDCIDRPPIVNPNDTSPEQEEARKTFANSLVSYLCPKGQYSPLGALFFNALSTVFKMLMSSDVTLSIFSLIAYFLVWYPFTLWTYGTNIPAGLFVSGILIGCAYGRLFGQILNKHISTDISPSTYAVVGAASLLSGYSRHTFSLAIIMMESTESIQLFIPITLTILVAYSVGGIFYRSIYTNAVRFKNIPFLVEKIPEGQESITANRIMSALVTSLQEVPKVSELIDILKSTSHNGFPVLNETGKLKGVISRKIIMLILQKKCWQGCEREDVIAKYDHVIRLSAELKKDTGENEIRVSLNQDMEQFQSQLIETGDGLVEEPYHIEDIIKDLPVTWEDFNQGFHAVCPPLSSIENSLVDVLDFVLDMRPYMEHRPHSVEPEDTLQKILDIFRLNNLRYMPVVKNQQVVGIITRQDIFAYMSI